MSLKYSIVSAICSNYFCKMISIIRNNYYHRLVAIVTVFILNKVFMPNLQYFQFFFDSENDCMDNSDESYLLCNNPMGAWFRGLVPNGNAVMISENDIDDLAI